MKLKDRRLKILSIEKCPSIEALSDRLKKLSFGLMKSLFVLLIEFSEEIHALTESELDFMPEIFNDDRPAILQLNSLDGKNNQVFIKNYKEKKITKLSATEDTACADIQILKEIFKAHGRLDGDILTSEISLIERSSLSERIAGSVLCLRFINLFVGRSRRIIPWLTASSVSKLNNLQVFLANINYPFELMAAVELAWSLGRFKILKSLLSQGCPFPNHFNVYRIPLKFRAKFQIIIQQRQSLHKNVAKGNKKDVLKILKKMKKDGLLKRVYNQYNNSTMEIALKYFNADTYAVLLQNNLQFCQKSAQLMQKLPKKRERSFLTPTRNIASH